MTSTDQLASNSDESAVRTTAASLSADAGIRSESVHEDTAHQDRVSAGTVPHTDRTYRILAALAKLSEDFIQAQPAETEDRRALDQHAATSEEATGDGEF